VSGETSIKDKDVLNPDTSPFRLQNYSPIPTDFGILCPISTIPNPLSPIPVTMNTDESFGNGSIVNMMSSTKINNAQKTTSVDIVEIPNVDSIDRRPTLSKHIN
jgi:hypothetical protein